MEGERHGYPIRAYDIRCTRRSSVSLGSEQFRRDKQFRVGATPAMVWLPLSLEESALGWELAH